MLRAIKSLGIADAYVNERNDICVGKFKICPPRSYGSTMKDADNGTGFGRHVSGSAYKIVNRRAYHHGTMLISTELGTLGNLLHSNKVPNASLSNLSLELTLRNHLRTQCKQKGWHQSVRPSAIFDNTNQAYRTKTSCTPSYVNSRIIMVLEKR